MWLALSSYNIEWKSHIESNVSLIFKHKYNESLAYIRSFSLKSFKLTVSVRHFTIVCLLSLTAAIMCPSLFPPPNGVITYSPDNTFPYAYQTMATYSCILGYGLFGQTTRTCIESALGGGEWSDGADPTCQGKCWKVQTIMNDINTTFFVKALTVMQSPHTKYMQLINPFQYHSCSSHCMAFILLQLSLVLLCQRLVTDRSLTPWTHLHPTNMVLWQRTCVTQAMEWAEERVCCSAVEMAQTQLDPGVPLYPLVNVSCGSLSCTFFAWSRG